MARKKKSSGRMNKGPFNFGDLERVITAQGWERIKGKTKHPAYKHPTKAGKVNLDEKWTGVKYGSTVFTSVAEQAGLTPKELLKLLNE